MFILGSLLTLPLLIKIHQLNKLLGSVFLHMFILRSLLLTLPSSSKSTKCSEEVGYLCG
jgi:hypothetical protein